MKKVEELGQILKSLLEIENRTNKARMELLNGCPSFADGEIRKLLAEVANLQLLLDPTS